MLVGTCFELIFVLLKLHILDIQYVQIKLGCHIVPLWLNMGSRAVCVPLVVTGILLNCFRFRFVSSRGAGCSCKYSQID